MSSNAPFVISGPGGGAPNRLEINDFVKNEKHFSLYIQALQAIYNDNQSTLTSFFQIAGIHGLPYIPWNDPNGTWDPSRSPWGGYCVHGSTLFPTWHRPYIMLIEQVIWQQAQTIAATYTVDPQGWKKAASDLRQPFWDWASNAVPPAEVISLKQVTITNSSGKRVQVDNPLYHYTFHPIDPSFPSPYSQWGTTYRRPDSTGSSPNDNVNELRNLLRSMQNNITSATYNMLTRVHTWPAFSSHTVGDGGSTSNSLEAIHDNIHVFVGGSGHMSDPSVAGFDPIFFMHHTNVDRLLSLWQAMNPGVWVTQGDAEDGTFTLPREAPVDATTNLTPFRDNQTGFWASAEVTDTAKLGYTYPDFNGLDMGDTTAVKTALTQRINRLYGGSIFGVFSNISPPASLAATGDAAGQAKTAGGPQATFSAQIANNPGQRSLPGGASGEHGGPPGPFGGPPGGHGGPPGPHDPASLQGVSLWDWTARVEFRKFELGRSFSVLLFLGSVPEDPSQWLVSPNLVGAHQAFVNTSDQCENCRTHRNIVEEGFVHLNHGIITLSGLGSLEPDVVEPYLTKELHWRIQNTNGDAAELQSLEVTIFATPLSLPPGADIPIPGTRRRCSGVTSGKPGGCRHA